MVSILEVYNLECTRCGEKQRVQRLYVDGNLAEIERTWVCPKCREEARAESPPDDEG